MDRLKATITSLMELGFTELYLSDIRTVSKDLQTLEKDKEELLKELYKRMEAERKCVVYEGSSGYVFGEGNPDAKVVFVGEAPGEEEDLQKRPFVGRAGQYLNTVLEKVGLRREDVYITNVVKSRPPENRKPTLQEMASCIPYLKKEIDIIKPKVIVCLGATAYEGIFGKKAAITKVRGSVLPYPYNSEIKVLITYHPAYILRSKNPRVEMEFFQDLKKVVELL